MMETDGWRARHRIMRGRSGLDTDTKDTAPVCCQQAGAAGIM